jgi:hypothetical protein
VIHGAGAHRPYETLDKFVRGFWNVLAASDPDLNPEWRHQLFRYPDRIEHYVALAHQKKPKLDFYEYYWDHYMDHDIALQEVIQWLYQASLSATRFYRKKPELSKRHEEMGSDLFQDGEFRVGGYFIYLGWIGHILAWVQRLGLSRIPLVSSLASFMLAQSAEMMTQTMGDVVIYTTADTRSKSYAIRQRVLDGAVEALQGLIQRDDYKQIIVVGHSLGSVIAYDALNRIILDINTSRGFDPGQARKIVGLVSFGSPLDKVAFFFREHTQRERFVRRQLLAHMHGFKSRPFPDEEEPITLSSPIQHNLCHARWLNFYHLKDPVSGHLDAYDVDKNVLCEAAVSGAAEAHRVYWVCDPIYEEISGAFFRGSLDPFLV